MIKMMPPFLGNGFEPEFMYSLIVVILCFLVYHRTKEVYELTKHQGIKYFRSAFLFFGLAYVSRFLLHLVILTGISFRFIIPRRIMFFPMVTVPVTYFSTMAIFFLIYSTVWKKIKYKNFLIFSNVVAVFLSVAAFFSVTFSRSLILVSVLQLALLLFTVIISTRNHKKSKRNYTRTLYFLILILWLVNLFLLSPGRVMHHGYKILFQAVSIVVFVAVYLKVLKWIK